MAKNRAERAEELLAQREAIVSFGRLALQSEDLDEVLQEACRLTAEALGTELSKVMELQEDGRSLLVVAGVGWDDGVVGVERIPALERSSEGYALKTGRPAVSGNVDEEQRFDYADFLKRHGVKAIVNVVVPGPEGCPAYGLLQVDSREERRFDRNDIEFLQSYANLLGAAIERHRVQRELAEALRTQERLLAELQHRINNNLTVVSALLRLKAGRSAHPEVKQEISEVMRQIDVLKDVYRQLHSSGQVDEIDLGGHLASLCNGVVNFNSGGKPPLHVETHTEAVLVEAKTAVTLGLVANEFFTNSVKHRPQDRGLTVSLAVRLEEDALSVELADDGEGLGDALDNKADPSSGSGIVLIEGLLRQLGAEWQWSSEAGTRLAVSIPIAVQAVRRLAE